MAEARQPEAIVWATSPTASEARMLPLGWSCAPGPGSEPLADPFDDERGVVVHKADQRRAARVLVVHAQEIQARGLGHAAAMDRRAGLVDGVGYADPRVVRAEARRPHDR